jgi:hypothetical protein
MDTAEARSLLRQALAAYRDQPYEVLAGYIRAPRTEIRVGASGVEYQIEIVVVWDSQLGGNVRVLGTIDDGGWRALAPLGVDFIKSPDGAFVGE